MGIALNNSPGRDAKSDFTYPGPLPKEALEYFRAKKLRVGFDYRDVWREEHAVSFTVAKAMTSNLLGTIHSGIEAALVQGTPYRQFAKELTPLLQKAGWWGKKEMTDPKTGETVKAQLGSPSRLHLIYDTNVRQARAAGQWERIQRTKTIAPYLLYQLGPSKRHRPEHASWEGTLLPADDPWWDSHMPINGYRCKCHVIQVTDYRAEKLGGETPRPPTELIDWTNKRTGQTMKVHKGIDPGFDYNPGQLRQRALNPSPAKLPPAYLPVVQPSSPSPKTVEEAEQWALDRNLADQVGYAGIRRAATPAVNEFNNALAKAIQRHPMLRSRLNFIGTIQERNRRMKAAVRKEAHQAALKAGLTEEQAVKRAELRVKSWAKVHEVSRTDSSILAQAWNYPGFMSLTINQIVANEDPGKLAQALAKDVQSGYRPVGCNTIKSLADHEVGHHLDYMLGVRQRPQFKAIHQKAVDQGFFHVKHNLSSYAYKKGPVEFVAEAWAEYTNNTQPRAIAKEVGDLITKLYNDMYGGTKK